jgi:hypothetical protein
VLGVGEIVCGEEAERVGGIRKQMSRVLGGGEDRSKFVGQRDRIGAVRRPGSTIHIDGGSFNED